MRKDVETNKLDRRKVLRYVAGAGMLAAGAYLLGRSFSESEEERPDPETVLNRIKELEFKPGSYLGATIAPRKIIWELNQYSKASGQEIKGNDESDWLSNTDRMEAAFKSLSLQGIKRGRLVILPFEVVTGEREYDWAAFDTAIDLMDQHQIKVDISAGPIGYPFYPGGRLPEYLQEMVKAEAAQSGNKQLIVDTGIDANYPASSAAVRDFTQEYLDALLNRYGKDNRVERFYIGSEWPDNQWIEGIDDIQLRFGNQLMRETIKQAKQQTTKQIALTTNKHPVQIQEITNIFGPYFQELGPQGALGIDTYPTRENDVNQLKSANRRYDELVSQIQKEFPETYLFFGEYQASPWPPEGTQAGSWIELWNKYPNIILDFYQKQFPPTLESHLIPSGVTESSLWEASIFPVLQQANYQFPTEMLSAIAKKMDQA